MRENKILTPLITFAAESWNSHKNFNSHIEIVELNLKCPIFETFMSIVVVGNLKKLEK